MLKVMPNSNFIIVSYSPKIFVPAEFAGMPDVLLFKVIKLGKAALLDSEYGANVGIKWFLWAQYKLYYKVSKL